MNTRWIILFSFFYLLLLNNQAEAQRTYRRTSPTGKRRFLIERIVEVFGCYPMSERLTIVKVFVKVKFLFLSCSTKIRPRKLLSDLTMNCPCPSGEKFVKKRSVGVLIMITFENHERAYLAVNGKHSSD